MILDLVLSARNSRPLRPKRDFGFECTPPIAVIVVVSSGGGSWTRCRLGFTLLREPNVGTPPARLVILRRWTRVTLKKYQTGIYVIREHRETDVAIGERHMIMGVGAQWSLGEPPVARGLVAHPRPRGLKLSLLDSERRWMDHLPVPWYCRALVDEARALKNAGGSLTL